MSVIDVAGNRSRRAALALAVAVLAAGGAAPAVAEDDIEEIKGQLESLRQEYDQRLRSLEESLRAAEERARQAREEAAAAAAPVVPAAPAAPAAPAVGSAARAFNPAISLIFDGRYGAFDKDPEEYELPGFPLDEDAGPGDEGFALGHTEFYASGNIDDRFYGQLAFALDQHDGAVELELEEVFVQTLGLGYGFTLRAGRFYSALGYLNQQHEHVWDFADAPLIYWGLFGHRQLSDDGLRASYVAPLDTFLEVGAELFRGDRFPAAGSGHDGVGAWSAFARIGGDIGIEHSWQLGFAQWRADDVSDRQSSGGHGHDDGGAGETPSFSGDSRVRALDFVYKWAPLGNPRVRQFKFQFEYLARREDGDVVLLNSDPLEATSYKGRQSGWYAQAAYRFLPSWRAGVRYDRVRADNSGSDEDVLAEAGLDDEGRRPRRYSLMLEWLPSEFSRLRLQYNRDKSSAAADDQVFLQYTHSLGAHGAHSY